MNFAHLEIPRITSDKVFENLCRDVWKNKSGYSLVELFGREGQNQHGVDIIGRDAKRNWFGIQCKVREGIIKSSDVEHDIEAAKSNNPRIDRLIICTTSKRDVGFQEYIRSANEIQKKAGSFDIEVKFWNEIEEELKEEQNLNIYKKYYKGHFAYAQFFGDVSGKIVSLDLSIDGKVDTHFELMIMRSTSSSSGSHDGIEYFKGVNYMTNLNTKTLSTFRTGKAHPNDFIEITNSAIDRLRIAKWVNKYKTIESLLELKTSEEMISITASEYEKFLLRHEEN